MKQSISEKLAKLGLDLDFLGWLEGEADRLPRLHATAGISPEDYAVALGVTSLLSQYAFQEELIAPQTLQEWLQRYDILERFLLAALKDSMIGRILSADKDLETLERVLEALLPPSSREEIKRDILLLRRKGQPAKFPAGPKQPSGGKRESEQTSRMRAAVLYVHSVSSKPYADLANFWNHWLEKTNGAAKGQHVYHPDEIKSRLRIKSFKYAALKSGDYDLEGWKAIYAGDFKCVWPTVFPLSRELRELAKQRQRAGSGNIQE